MSKDTAIQIIELLSEKLEILVDYTSENVIPYAIDLMHRYIIYINISNFISLFIKIIILSICIIIAKKSLKKVKIESNTAKSNYDSMIYAMMGSIGIICGIGSLIFGLLFIIPETIEFIQILLKSLITPELFMIEQLRNL